MINWDNLMDVWGEFRKFLDRAFQWLQYVFGAIDECPPVDYPEIDAEK